MTRLLLAWPLCLAVAAAAQAAPIPGLYATGVDDAGDRLPGGSVDPHYRLFDDMRADAPSYVVGTLPGTYVPNSATSAWIWENADGSPSFVVRTYRLTFDLSGFDPATVSISGTWGVDDAGRDIIVNGVSTGQSMVGFGAFEPFLLRAGFVAGINTIDYVVENAGGPGAFRVDTIAGDAVRLPEPASAALALLALTLVAARRSARR